MVNINNSYLPDTSMLSCFLTTIYTSPFTSWEETFFRRASCFSSFLKLSNVAPFTVFQNIFYSWAAARITCIYIFFPTKKHQLNDANLKLTYSHQMHSGDSSEVSPHSHLKLHVYRTVAAGTVCQFGVSLLQIHFVGGGFVKCFHCISLDVYLKLHFHAPDYRHASVHSVCWGLCTHAKKICQQEHKHVHWLYTDRYWILVTNVNIGKSKCAEDNKHVSAGVWWTILNLY